MSIFKRKTVAVPTGETKTCEAADLWEVRWEGRNGPFSHDTFPTVEVFFTEESAKEFAERLRDAYKLLKITGVCHIEISKSKYSGVK